MTSPPPAARRLPAAFVRAVFFSTPLFVALDLFYGISLRIPFLDASPAVVMVNPFTPEKVASLVLSVSVLSASYMMQQAAGSGLRAAG